MLPIFDDSYSKISRGYQRSLDKLNDSDAENCRITDTSYSTSQFHDTNDTISDTLSSDTNGSLNMLYLEKHRSFLSTSNKQHSLICDDQRPNDELELMNLIKYEH